MKNKKSGQQLGFQKVWKILLSFEIMFWSGKSFEIMFWLENLFEFLLWYENSNKFIWICVLTKEIELTFLFWLVKSSNFICICVLTGKIQQIDMNFCFDVYCIFSNQICFLIRKVQKIVFNFVFWQVPGTLCFKCLRSFAYL